MLLQLLKINGGPSCQTTTIFLPDLLAPASAAVRVHDDLMLMMESEVDVEHDVWSRQELDGEVPG